MNLLLKPTGSTVDTDVFRVRLICVELNNITLLPLSRV